MRIVIYDDESFEPITVINLPGLAGRDIAQRMSVSDITMPSDEPPTSSGIPIVDMEFERVVRRTLRHGDQEHWLCFTKAAGLAKKLNPAWLPGQRPAIDELQRQNDRLAELMLAGLRT